MMEDPVTEVPQESRAVSQPPQKMTAKKTDHGMSSSKKVILGAILIIFIAISSGFVGGLIGAKNRAAGSNANVEQGRQVVEEQSSLISSIAKEVGPSVVSVDVTSQGMASSRYYGTRSIDQQSAGTGFIISDNGYVVTNRHVIPDGTKSVNLTLSDGTVLDNVSVVGKTSSSDSLDLAFLKINDAKGKTLTVAKIGDSSRMQVGDTVIAIGNALGQFQNSVTSGIISGYGRSVQASDETGANAENLQNLFQTDAAINQGNSGGPLVNSDGEVIGINTAVAGDAQNIGFAIPVNDAKGLIKSVLDKGNLERPYLGVQYQQLTPAIATRLGVSTQEGAYIGAGEDGSAIIADSPAAKAGLKDGDIIVKVNNDNVTTTNNLSSLIGRYGVGETVTLTILRDGKEQSVKATLMALPNN